MAPGSRYCSSGRGAVDKYKCLLSSGYSHVNTSGLRFSSQRHLVQMGMTARAQGSIEAVICVFRYGTTHAHELHISTTLTHDASPRSAESCSIWRPDI